MPCLPRIWLPTDCLSPFQIFLSFFSPLPHSHFSSLSIQDRHSWFGRDQHPLLLWSVSSITATPRLHCLSTQRTNSGAKRPLLDISCLFVTPHRLFLALRFSLPARTMSRRSRGVWSGLTALSILVLVQWAGSCWAMTLNSVPLRPVPDAPLRVEDEDPVLHRHKRNWVWNQFFVLEEYTGDDPLYVGKVSQLYKSK